MKIFKMKKLLLAFLVVISSTLSLLAVEEDPVFIRGIRPLGMGGAFVAIADDQNAVFYNPAGLTQRQSSQFTLFELPININEDSLKFYKFYQDNESKLKDYVKLTPDEQQKLVSDINNNIIGTEAGLRTGLPNISYLSGTGKLKWGVGLFNQETLHFRFDPTSISLPPPSLSFWGTADIMAGVPLAYRFESVPHMPGKLSVGATVKYLERGKISEMNKSILEFEKLDPKIQWGHGIGADLGTLYQPTSRWNIGLQVSDVGGTSIKYEEVTKNGTVDKSAETSMIKPLWNAGAAFIPSKIYYWPNKSINTHDRLILACDVRDFMSTDERVTDATFFKKLHMGAEFRWGPMSLRTGLSSGYPSFGAGIRLPYLGLRCEYAYWADELGRYAGQRPDWNHQLTVAFSWGDSKGRAYGNDVSAAVKAADAPAAVKTGDAAPAKEQVNAVN